MADNIIQAGIVGVFSNQGSRLALGRKAASMQNFTHIDVAKTCNDPLIKQGGLQGGGFFPKPAGQKIGAEFIAEGLHANVFQKPMACHFIFMEQVHDAEAAMVGVDNLHPIIEQEDHMVMGSGTSAIGTLFKIKFPQIVWLRVFIQNRETPGHAEMHQKTMAVVKVNQNILGPALEAHDMPALQPGRETSRKGKAKAGPPKLHAGNGTANEDGA